VRSESVWNSYVFLKENCRCISAACSKVAQIQTRARLIGVVTDAGCWFGSRSLLLLLLLPRSVLLVQWTQGISASSYAIFPHSFKIRLLSYFLTRFVYKTCFESELCFMML